MPEMWEELSKRLKNPDSLVSLLLGLAVVAVVGVLIFNYVTGRRGLISPPAEEGKPEVPTSLPTTHEVGQGETLWGIAEKYYTSGYNWVDIATASSLTNPDYLEVGQKLTIPAVPVRLPEGQISAAATEVQKPKEGNYAVKRDDNLWEIALSIYGSGYRWVDIARANNLANPDLIHAGNVLTLP